MPTADIDQGNSCGYVEEISTTGAASVHFPRGSSEKFTTAGNGVVVTRKYCIARAGHSGGHTYRTV